MVTTIKRDGNTTYTNSYTNNFTYYTSNGDVYTVDHGMLLNFVEDGIKVEATDVTLAKNDTILAEGYAKAKVKTVENMGDVFENAHADLSKVKVIDWDTIKNDTASFVDDVINEARENVSIFDFTF